MQTTGASDGSDLGSSVPQCRRRVVGLVATAIARRRITRAAVPLISDPVAAPSTRLMTAVAAFWDSGAVVLNGYTTAITVASPMIQVKNICGRGVAIRSRA